jgi:putative acetyltransferase
MDITIRRETVADYREVEEMVREAFWNLYVPGCDEHYLAHIIRGHEDFIPELDYVAELNGKIVGSILYTKSKAIAEDGTELETVSFGPVCVHPDFQRKGIGSKLIRHTIALLKEQGIKALMILGHPYNYVTYGFKNCIDFNVSDSEGRYPMGQLVLELEPGVFKGKKWQAVFSSVCDVDSQKVLEFDKQFPEKEKKYQPSQEDFSITVRAYLG